MGELGCWQLLPAYLRATAARARQVERSLHCDYGHGPRYLKDTEGRAMAYMTQRPTHGIRLVRCTAATGTGAFSNCDTENYGIE